MIAEAAGSIRVAHAKIRLQSTVKTRTHHQLHQTENATVPARAVLGKHTHTHTNLCITTNIHPSTLRHNSQTIGN